MRRSKEEQGGHEVTGYGRETHHKTLNDGLWVCPQSDSEWNLPAPIASRIPPQFPLTLSSSHTLASLSCFPPPSVSST